MKVQILIVNTFAYKVQRKAYIVLKKPVVYSFDLAVISGLIICKYNYLHTRWKNY